MLRTTSGSVESLRLPEFLLGDELLDGARSQAGVVVRSSSGKIVGNVSLEGSDHRRGRGLQGLIHLDKGVARRARRQVAALQGTRMATASCSWGVLVDHVVEEEVKPLHEGHEDRCARAAQVSNTETP